MTFEFERVRTEDDAQIMRKIRNECRSFMTRNTKYISKRQQSIWYRSLDENVFKLYLAKADGVNVGYGILRVENDVFLVTGGVVKSFRGKGIGKYIFQSLIDEACVIDSSKKIELEVLNTNKPAKSLYDKLGFIEIEKTERITKMEYKNDSSI